jgi:hypothetical protein
MRKTIAVIAWLLAPAAAGCYGSAPPRPAQIPLPPPAAGASIDVSSVVRTEMEQVQKQASSCPAGQPEGSAACTITRYEVAEPITRTITTASYNGAPISYGQFRILTDPHYDAKLGQLADLSRTCRRANIPRYAGMALMLGSLLGPALVDETAGKVIFWGGLGGGLAAYALGYVALGGRQCNAARALYHELDMSEEAAWSAVRGADRAAEMRSLADDFNARMRGPTASRGLRMR